MTTKKVEKGAEETDNSESGSEESKSKAEECIEEYTEKDSVKRYYF